MSMLDDLVKIKQQIDALKPKDHFDIILSTRWPIASENGLLVEYEGKTYLILNWTVVDKIKAECDVYQRMKPTQESIIGYQSMPMFGIPVVENDELVEKIFLHIAGRYNKANAADP